MNIRFKKNNRKQGITLFIAVSVASLVLILLLNVMAIAIKEVQLSGFVRESQEAFYAADAGIECAIYHDLFTGGSSPFPEPTEPQGPATLKCIDDMNMIYVDNGTYATSTFAVRFSDTNDDAACAIVTVAKGNGLVKIESFGVNKHDADTSQDADCDGATNQIRRVERALRATYPY